MLSPSKFFDLLSLRMHPKDREILELRKRVQRIARRITIVKIIFGALFLILVFLIYASVTGSFI